MSEIPAWLAREFERAAERSKFIPAWARPVVCKKRQATR